MTLKRRDVIQASAGAICALALPAHAQTHNLPDVGPSTEEVIADFLGDAEITDGDVELVLPEVAEDGYRVEVFINAPGASEIALIAPGNPFKRIAHAHFGPLSATQQLSTRMRLAQTQDVMALARMPDGRVHKAVAHVDVLVGGCA